MTKKEVIAWRELVIKRLLMITRVKYGDKETLEYMRTNTCGWCNDVIGIKHDCSTCKHIVLQANHKIVHAPCKKEY